MTAALAQTGLHERRWTARPVARQHQEDSIAGDLRACRDDVLADVLAGALVQGFCGRTGPRECRAGPEEGLGG